MARFASATRGELLCYNREFPVPASIHARRLFF